PPAGLGHDQTLVKRVIRAAGKPAVFYWEGDPWHRWAKPFTGSMRAWLRAADIVFSVVGEPQAGLMRRAGAREVRFIPQTYCHVQFRDAENDVPADPAEIEYDVVIVGSRFAHLGLISRLPGAAERASMVRRLTRSNLRLAVY